MIAVTAIITLMVSLVVPAVTHLNSATDVTKGAYDIAGLLEEARAYAKAKSTYTWVGFFEEDASQSPGTPGVGRVVLSLIASKDGTAIYPVMGDQMPLNSSNLVQIDKLVKINNAHLVALTPTDVPNRTDVPDSSSGYQVGLDSFGEHVTPPATTATPNKVTFNYPLQGTSYTFVKIIQFNPFGDATKIVDTPAQIMEIGLRPTHVNAVDNGTTNCVAIQVAGIGGQVRIYRP